MVCFLVYVDGVVYICDVGVPHHQCLKIYDDMKYVTIPDNGSHKLPFYLAMEEYVARNFDEGDCFFMWQVAPTVIVGRNQVVECEVNLDYCREHNIEVYRRKSGGGCVYADGSNIMFSYITSGASSVATTFSRYTSMVAEMLRSLGLDASDTSRNDILVGERKVSGNAFYHLGDRSIVHGTMLYDTDMAHITSAITPAQDKLEARGVKSVRSRITTLAEHLDMDIEEFKSYARRHLCDGELNLSVADVEKIASLSEHYYEAGWIYGRSQEGGRRSRVEGAGEISVQVATTPEGLIDGINLSGDFLEVADIDELLINPLRRVHFDRKSVEDALTSVPADNVIYGLSKAQFIDLLF